MSNIIQLLATMGADASLQHPGKVEQLIAKSQLSDELKQALYDRDAMALAHQIDGCPDIICIAIHPSQQEPADMPVPDDDEPAIRAVAYG